jgi:hypothetical protein
MFGDWLRTTGFLLLFGLAGVTSASADGPGRKFKLLTDATMTSPDRQLLADFADNDAKAVKTFGPAHD